MADGLILPGRVTPTGLQLPASLGYDEWLKCGEVLHTIEGAVLWWVGDWYNHGDRHYGEKAAQAIGGDAGLAEQTVLDAGWVSRKIEPSNRVENLSWSHHRAVADLDAGEQRKWLARAVKEKWTRNELRAAIQEAKQLPPPKPPKGQYRVILADPPWDYSNSGFQQSAAQHYQTMPTDEIAALKVPAAKDAVLFLWATSPMLPDALRVIDGWGFTYKASFAWIKARAPGIGWFVRTRHELLLIAVRGEIGHPPEQPDSIIDGKVSQHSRKPDEAYGIIEAMYDGPYIEMFARRPRDGWTPWGNEVQAA